MRQGQQNRRGRGRNQGHNGRKHQNPLTRTFESTGPDVKIRGTPAHVAEKYVALARDALSSGDPVLAENYLQHAEHYNRIIMTYREQQQQQQAQANEQPRVRDDDNAGDEDGGDDGDAPPAKGGGRRGNRKNGHASDEQPSLDSAGDDEQAAASGGSNGDQEGERPQRRNGRGRRGTRERAPRGEAAFGDQQPDFLTKAVPSSGRRSDERNDADDQPAQAADTPAEATAEAAK